MGKLFRSPVNAPITITAVIYLLSGSPACVMDGILITIGIFSPEVNRAKMVVHNKSLKQNSITFLLEDTRPGQQNYSVH